MNGVIYARYSSDNQREESIEGQLRECRAFAERSGITVVGEYLDRAKSATTANRPDFQRMISESSSHAFEVIIVWKLDRFARNRYDSAHYKAQLRKNGVKVVSATEAISDGAEGVLLESVLEGMAEYYSKELGEKTLRGMTENALKCKHNGGKCPLGYKVDSDLHYVIDDKYAPMVEEAFRLYDDGWNIRKIVTEYNARGITTQYGKKITINTITNMLHNRKYIGEYKFKDVIIPNGMPALIEEALFDRVQEKLKLTKKAPSHFMAEDEYLLTTKLFCGKCGKMMTGESGTSRNGTVYRYYRCNGVRYHSGCDKKNIKKNLIEDFVVNRVAQTICDDEFINGLVTQILEYQSEENKVLPILQSQLRDVEKKIENLITAIENGICNVSTKRRLDELEKRQRELEIDISNEKVQNKGVSEPEIRKFFEQFNGIDTSVLANRRKLTNVFVNAIYLYDDELKLILNYKNKTEVVSISEIEKVDFGASRSLLGEPVERYRNVSLFFYVVGKDSSQRQVAPNLVSEASNKFGRNSPVDCFVATAKP